MIFNIARMHKVYMNYLPPFEYYGGNGSPLLDFLVWTIQPAIGEYSMATMMLYFFVFRPFVAITGNTLSNHQLKRFYESSKYVYFESKFEMEQFIKAHPQHAKHLSKYGRY